MRYGDYDDDDEPEGGYVPVRRPFIESSLRQQQQENEPAQRQQRQQRLQRAPGQAPRPRTFRPTIPSERRDVERGTLASSGLADNPTAEDMLGEMFATRDRYSSSSRSLANDRYRGASLAAFGLAEGPILAGIGDGG